MTDKKRSKGSIFFLIAVILVFIAGIGILLYPTLSNMWNEYRNSKLITDYTHNVQTINAEKYADIIKEAREYNDNHKVNTIVDAFEDEKYTLTHPYDTLLDPLGNGIMGYVSIPDIDITLPIYHGVGAYALEHGCGHVEGTSLPIGGKGTHSVLAAHRGLPEAKLFTDLDQIREGDLFFITVLDEKMAYEVDNISVVEPLDLEGLKIDEEADLVTLLTCTPYSVNTHRLLVRGHRVEVPPEEIEKLEKEVKVRSRRDVILLGIAVLVLILAYPAYRIYKKIKKHRKDK